MIVLLSLLIYKTTKNIPEKKTTKIPENVDYRFIENCYNITNSNERTECIDKNKRLDGEYNLNIKKCLEIQSNHHKVQCVISVAKKLNNVTNCDYILNKTMRDICYSTVAEWNRNKTLCLKKLENHEAQECVDRITSFNATDNLDMTSCLTIKTTEYKNLCFENIINHYGLDYCYNLSYFKDASKCLSMILFRTAIMKKNISMCKTIPLENYKKVCEIRLNNPNKKLSELDSDNDGLDDSNELFIGTDPFNNDTDGDGIIDRYDFEDLT